MYVCMQRTDRNESLRRNEFRTGNEDEDENYDTH